MATSDKQRNIQELISLLRDDITPPRINSTARFKALEQLKIYSRDPAGNDEMYAASGIEVLGQHGFIVNTEDRYSAREAQRALANALLMAPKTRQFVVDCGFHEKAAEGFKSTDVDDEFLLARILLLITYDTTADLKALLKEHGLEQGVREALARHAEDSRASNPMATMALSETLKLYFNLAHLVTDEKGLIVGCVPTLFKILQQLKLAPFPLQPPLTNILNAVVGVGLSACKDVAFPPEDPLLHVSKLVDILDKAIDPKFTKPGTNTSESWDESGTPLVSLLRAMADIAGDGVKKYLKSRLLPSEEERKQPLGKGTTLAARLLQLSSSASAPNTREHISWLLFMLSDSDAEQFILNIGYGYASGFLLTHNIPLPKSSDMPSTSASSRPINPITGQTLDSEPPAGDPFAGMSQEEKEREAERLFVLFERLKKTGVIDVENPVRQAVEQGRFQELPDDDADD